MPQCEGLTKRGTRCAHKQQGRFCRMHEGSKAPKMDGPKMDGPKKDIIPKKCCTSKFTKCAKSIQVMINGVSFKVWEFQPGYARFYKAMSSGQTPETNSDYFSRKKRPFVSWFGSKDTAQWYVDNWADNKRIYTFEVVKPMRLLDLSNMSNAKKLMSVLDADTSAALKCALGVDISEKEQYEKCHTFYRGPDGNGYPLIPPKEDLKKEDDHKLKRWSDQDVDKELSTKLCRKLFVPANIHGYIASDITTRYGTTNGVFPEEIMTCFQPDVLRMVRD